MQRQLRHLILVCLLAPTLAWAQDDSLLMPVFAAVELDRENGDSTTLAGAVDEQHAEWSDRVVDIGRRLDQFFGGERYSRDAKTSELRLGLTTRLTDEGVDFDTRVRFRLALPNTERRLSVVLESAEEDFFGRSDSDDISGFSSRPLEDDEEYFAGFRYIRRFADVLDLDTDAGVKLRMPPDPYLRVRGGRSWFVELWEARLSQSLFWRRSEGRGATTELVLQRALEGPQFLQAVTQATWMDRDERFYYGQSLTVSHEFSDLHAIQLRLGVTGESEPNAQVTSYFMHLPWRRNIYRKWLYLEVRPELLFERATEFDAQPRLFFVLEAYFGDRHVANQMEPPIHEPLPQPPPAPQTAPQTASAGQVSLPAGG